MQATKIIGCAVGAVMATCLISGIQVLHDAAFYAAIALSTMSSISLLSIPSTYTRGKAIRYLKGWPATAIFSFYVWYAYAASGHPILLAWSFINTIMIVSLMLAALNKDDE